MRRVLCVSVRTGSSTVADAATSASQVTIDLAVEVDPQHRVDELTVALAKATGAPTNSVLELARSGRMPRPDRPLASVDVCDGDILTLHPPQSRSVPSGQCTPTGVAARRPATGTASALAAPVENANGDNHMVLDVIAGPSAERSYPLRVGRNHVGRSPAADVQLFDRHASRHELDIVVAGRPGFDAEAGVGAGEWGVRLIPRHSTNGIAVNGTATDVPTELSPADVISVGRSRFVVRSRSVVRGRKVVPGRVSQSCGVVEFFRTPYRSEQPERAEVELFDSVPAEPTSRRLGIIMVIAPLLAGVGMYLMTRRAMFLMFTALSPVMAVGRYVEDRRSGRSDFRKEVAEFRQRLAEYVAGLVERRADERRARAAAHPDLFELERRAAHRSSDLWIRHRGAADLCAFRLGVGSASTHFEVGIKPGGHGPLHREAAEAIVGMDLLDDVPVTVDLARQPILGVHGHRGAAETLVSSLLIQAATLHSPEDLQIAVVADETRRLGWGKWLPHLRPDRSDLDGGQLAAGSAAGRILVASLTGLVGQRLERQGGASKPSTEWPRWLVVIDAELDLDSVECDRLLDVGPSVGISVVWLASQASGICRQASNIVDLSGIGDPSGIVDASGTTDCGGDAGGPARLWSTDVEVAERFFHLEPICRDRAERVARSLAPLRDVTSSAAATSIPSVVPLFDVLEVPRPDVDWVEARWARADRTGLRGRVGVAATGPVEIDLVHHGPHALIGGTSGAGKSELLQSTVLGLASQHPPHQLNFLFIDYKGGASSQMFAPLPHTVGLVTNLNESMAMRALESLRAELRYRMTLLDGRAKDLADLARIDPDAPPSLVLVCDEFATLVTEIPEFVAGIIDIAQRGRSLGVHLVLATQRPAGAVNDNILANTNLRIALRTIDRSDSSAIIDSPDAALIDPSKRGRFFMRVGPSSSVEVQSAFSSAPLEMKQVEPIRTARFIRPAIGLGALKSPDATSSDQRPVPVNPVPVNPVAGVPRGSNGEPNGHRNDGRIGEVERTQLDHLVDTIVAAHVASGRPAPRKPWREPLPEQIAIGDVQPDAPPSGAEVVIGLADYPADQAQAPLVVDLAATGGLAVFGSGGSGKTTLLRSLVASAREPTEVVVIDGASRPLVGLGDQARVVAVAAADDPEALTRLICVLEAEIDTRRRAGAEQSRVLLLIDEWGTMVTNLNEASSAAEAWVDRLQNLIGEGRALGIHTVLTADRSAAVSARLHSAIGSRLVLRHGDPSMYANYGIPSAVGKGLVLPPGRGLFDVTTMVQIATPESEHFGPRIGPRAKSRECERAVDATGVSSNSGRRPSSGTRPSRLVTAPLPGHLVLAPRPRPTFEPVVDIGIADVTGERVGVNLSVSDLAIAGHPGSGRSTALATALSSAVEAGYQVYAVGPAESPLAASGLLRLSEVKAGFDDESRETVVSDLVKRAAGGDQPLLLGVDDLDLLDESVGAAIERAGRRVRVVAAIDARALVGYSTNPALGRIKRSRNLVFLQPDDPSEVGQISGARVRIRPGTEIVPGRAVIVANRRVTLIQVAERIDDGTVRHLP